MDITIYMYLLHVPYIINMEEVVRIKVQVLLMFRPSYDSAMTPMRFEML